MTVYRSKPRWQVYAPYYLSKIRSIRNASGDGVVNLQGRSTRLSFLIGG